MTTLRRLEAAWLTEGALARVLAVLDGAGEEARLVGGTVRNALLGEPFGDADIATTALPAEVIRRVEAAGFNAVPTGIEHGEHARERAFGEPRGFEPPRRRHWLRPGTSLPFSTCAGV